MATPTDTLPDRLARNLKQLRDARGLTQQQMSRLSGLPRATWAQLESGEANPTLSVLHRAAQALQISIEELISPPRGDVRHHPASSLHVRRQGPVSVRKLLPEPIAGTEIDRMELPAQARFTGIPHTPGTREYLTCEAGAILLVVAGGEWRLAPGDVVSFRGDQRHSYVNPLDRTSIGYSVVVLAPA
jgi:transcriptional regulator with XRE-family HTH domain